jgi:hypothetical protein
MRWTLLVPLTVGCFATDDYPPPDPLPAEYTECEADEDCVVTELGCCDECNGGIAVAVRSDQEAEVVELYTETCREGQACTEIGCPPWVVTCDAGTCAAERGTFTGE